MNHCRKKIYEKDCGSRKIGKARSSQSGLIHMGKITLDLSAFDAMGDTLQTNSKKTKYLKGASDYEKIFDAYI